MQQITFHHLGSNQMKSAAGGENENSQLALGRSFLQLLPSRHRAKRGHGTDTGRLAMPVPSWYVISW